MTSPAQAAPTRRQATGWARRALPAGVGVLVLLLSAAPLVRHYVLVYPQEIWQVDLQVYREGARAVLRGEPLYDVRTVPPQYLPFTYPPFAALLGLPLAALPFLATGWWWTALQLGLLWFTVGVAFRPFLERFGPWHRAVQGLVAGGCVWMLPVAEGIRFGQVNALVVAVCVADVARRAPLPPRRLAVPRGVLVGLATAVKLTPGVFWLHWAAARRWRVLAVSVAAAATATVVTALVLPSASLLFWTDALADPTRLGPNAGTSNQSLRGVLLRIGPGDPTVSALVWLALAAVVLWLGLRVSVRLDRLGEQVAVVAVLGMVAVMVSPVSWVHHLHWGVVVVAALLGDGRVPARVVAAAAAAAVLWMRLPWWGVTLLAEGEVPRWSARLVQNGYALFAGLAVVALWWLVARPLTPAAGAPRPRGR